MTTKCRERANAAQAAYYQRNKEKIQAIQRERSKRKRIVNRDAVNAKKAAWRKANRDQVNASQRERYRAEARQEWNLLKKFGLTLGQYKQMLEAQNFVCAICRKPETALDYRTGKLKRLAVDHNHETGKVRGLLCVFHNRLLGVLEKDGLLRNIQDYLNLNCEDRNDG
jgi:hypothetical protein